MLTKLSIVIRTLESDKCFNYPEEKLCENMDPFGLRNHSLVNSSL